MPRCNHHLITSKSWDLCPQPASAHTECGPLKRFPGSPLSPGSQSCGMVSVRHPTPQSHLPPGCSLSWRPSSDTACRSLCAWPFPGCSSRQWCATVLWEDLGWWRKLQPRREAEEPEDESPWLLSSSLAFPTLESPFWTPPSAGLSAASCWDLCAPFKAWSPALYPPSPVTVSEARTR